MLTGTALVKEGRRLVPTLTWPHLVALGIGAIVGTGIYTLIGVGADKAGPAVLLSFVIAGMVCAVAALCYSELASMCPVSGSAYTYATLPEASKFVVCLAMLFGRLEIFTLLVMLSPEFWHEKTGW